MQRRSIHAGRTVVEPLQRRPKRDRRRGGDGLSFRARVLVRGDTMEEVQQTVSDRGAAVEGRTVGADPWTIIVYLEELHTADPGLWVRPVGMRDAMIRVTVWSAEGDRRCRFEHRLPWGSVISLRDLVRIGRVALRAGCRVELFRMENSGPVQVVAQGSVPKGRLV